jgi:hypothetical protein
MTYLVKENETSARHTGLADREASGRGITAPGGEIADGEFDAADRLARLISGKILPEKKSAGKFRFFKTRIADKNGISAKIADGSAVEEFMYRTWL